MAASLPGATQLPPIHSLTLSASPASSSSPSPSSSSAAPPPSAPIASTSSLATAPAPAEPPRASQDADDITYRAYEGEQDLDAIVSLVDDELSEPYNLYTYRYFLDEWPHLCFFAFHKSTPVGVIVCKLEPHTKSSRSLPVPGTVGEDGKEARRPLNRGYLAMLSTKKAFRGRGIATHLLRLSLSAMLRPPRTFLSSLPPSHPAHSPVDEIVLETEADNAAALGFYARMGFVREKRLHRFYLNSKDAFRLRLDLAVLGSGSGP
ncbi:hypothetical protein Rhopal_005664-T1 [Rhodotorula paludigena]|uniref:N-acetyltransferase domain-containing protein n=1 Tax=Rhodotorula paludigena TaxID=86838 RepID=A0AAV5GTR6_9BASI|nr:hypothetical protein Rhopal_005664-T1 [Rhodotorula paludigena]